MLTGWGWAEVKEGFVSGNHFPLFFRVHAGCRGTGRPRSGPRAPVRRRPGPGGLHHARGRSTCPVSTLWPASARSGPDLADIVQPGPVRPPGGQRSVRVAAETSRSLPSLLSLLRGARCAIEPWEDMVAWADPRPALGPRAGRPVVQCLHALPGPQGRRLPGFRPGTGTHPVLAVAHRLRLSGPVHGPACDHGSRLLPLHPTGAGRPLAGPAASPGPVRAAVTDRAARRMRASASPWTCPSSPGKMVVASLRLSTPLLSRVEEGMLKPPDTYLVAWEGRG